MPIRFLFLLSLFLSACKASTPPPLAEGSSVRGTLSGEVFLDSSAGAKQYRIKVKQQDTIRGESKRATGEPFRFEGLESGSYDLVVEAKGHSTFVQSAFAKVEGGKETRVAVKMSKAKTIFADGDATRIILCSACHKKIYMEMIRGEGADFRTGPWPGPDGKMIELPDLTRDFYADSSPEHLAYVAPITVATIAKQPEEKRDFCRSCHAPTLIHVGEEKPARPGLRKENREDGVSCVSCHLDSEGNIRGKFDLSAPHATVQDPLFTPARSAELCAACHQADAMAPNQQTVSEWKTDFAKNDPRTCQDCHMPQVVRRLSEIFSDRPERSIGKHLFAGGHSTPMLKTAATLSIEPDPRDPGALFIGVTNSGAGHSLPTGHGPRAVLLHVKLVGPAGDDLLDTTKSAPLAIYTVNRALGAASDIVHAGIRAGATEKTPFRLPEKPGRYTVRAMLFYDLDRLVDFNDHELPLIASTEKEVEIK